MSIFMTWDKKPFFAGTYFPARAQYGRPGFPDLLSAVAEQWNSRRERLLQSADLIIAHLRQPEAAHESIDNPDPVRKAVQMFSRSFDRRYGGFGDAPKFPAPHNLLFLTLYAEQNHDSRVMEMVEKTLTQMRRGGIFDHIGYGFSRYSTDAYFLVPHFEKMLYDNALLILAYAAACWVTGNPEYLDTAARTAAYVFREMTSPDGGFYSAQDADSEGVEGKYYTFTLSEILEVLGKEKGERFAGAFDITEKGNFEGTNIPNLLRSHDVTPDFCQETRTLYSYRKKRSRLHLDDKVLTSWNSMMIAALSVLYRVSRDKSCLEAAIRAQEFIERNLSEGLRLFTSWRDGTRSENSLLDDYAFYVAALTELYHATLDPGYLDRAEALCREAVKQFFDAGRGGFYLASFDSTELFMNPKESYDGAVPSGNSVMAYNLVRLYQLTGKEDLGELAEKQIRYLSAQIQGYPAGHSMFLLAKLIHDHPPMHMTVILKHHSDLEQIKEQLPLLANVILVPESRDYPLVNDSTTFYVCSNHTCFAPCNGMPSDRYPHPFYGQG